MTAKILDGKACATEIKRRIKEEIKSLGDESVVPKLVTLLVGDDPSSKLYLRKKHESCKEVGIVSENIHLPEDSTEDEVLNVVNRLNVDEEVTGVLVQLPLPNQISAHRVTETLSPAKDVDGLTPYNIGQITYRKGALLPCTPKGIVTLLKYNDIPITGQDTVIVGRSNLVGKPLQLLLTNLDATVTLCHSKTKNLLEHTINADMLVAAVGTRPHFLVEADAVREGAVVIDVGMNMVNGKLCGDVDFDAVAEKALHITPVPGGIGPMTVATLLENAVLAAALQAKKTIKALV